MTHLRKMMLEELQRRDFAATTVQYYLRAVEGLAKYFGNHPTGSAKRTCASTKLICSAKEG